MSPLDAGWSTTNEQRKDPGLAIVLICLLCGYFYTEKVLGAAIVFLVITMTYPPVFKYPAAFWFKFSHLLGTGVTKVILSICYFVIVTPIGLLRRILKYDSMQLSKFRNDSSSVFNERQHTFTGSDLEPPY